MIFHIFTVNKHLTKVVIIINIILVNTVIIICINLILIITVNNLSLKKKQRQKQQHTTFYKSSLTLRITALNNSGDLLQTAPTINPPALVPRAAVNCGLEYPKLCSALAQASKSCKVKYLSFFDKILWKQQNLWAVNDTYYPMTSIYLKAFMFIL